MTDLPRLHAALCCNIPHLCTSTHIWNLNHNTAQQRIKTGVKHLKCRLQKVRYSHSLGVMDNNYTAYNENLFMVSQTQNVSAKVNGHFECQFRQQEKAVCLGREAGVSNTVVGKYLHSTRVLLTDVVELRNSLGRHRVIRTDNCYASCLCCCNLSITSARLWTIYSTCSTHMYSRGSQSTINCFCARVCGLFYGGSQTEWRRWQCAECKYLQQQQQQQQHCFYRLTLLLVTGWSFQ